MSRIHARPPAWRRAALLLCTLLLCAPAARAIKGDRLYVRAQEAAVREAPRPEARRLLLLGRGHLLVGISETRRWIEVGVARSGGKVGWIARRSLSTVKMSAPPTPAPVSFEAFAQEMESFNQGVQQRAGILLFSRIDLPMHDMVHLSATPGWRALPTDARARSLARLSRRWADLRGHDRPTWVEVVDDRGRIMMSARYGR
jgi:hypothetical protein